MKKGGACPVACVKKDVRERPNSVLVHLVLVSVQVIHRPCCYCRVVDSSCAGRPRSDVVEAENLFAVKLRYALRSL